MMLWQASMQPMLTVSIIKNKIASPAIVIMRVKRQTLQFLEVLQRTIDRFKAPIEINNGVNHVKACRSIVLNLKYLHPPMKRQAPRIWSRLHVVRISCATH